MIFVDETVVSRFTNLKTVFSKMRKKVTMKDSMLKQKSISVVVAISLENGLEALQVFEGWINGVRYVAAMEQVNRF